MALFIDTKILLLYMNFNKEKTNAVCPCIGGLVGQNTVMLTQLRLDSH